MAAIGRIARATGAAKRERGEDKGAYCWISWASKLWDSGECS